MDQKIPDKPSTLSDTEWNYILNRDRHRCALFEQCQAQGQTGFCSHDLHVDHIHPQHLGGDDSWVNQRLLCAGPNCARPVEPAPQWTEWNIWDDPILIAGLRETQYNAGYGALSEPIIATCLTKHRNTLLKRITMVPGVTGVGKAVMMQSILYGINKATGIDRPRVKKVLWLTTDTTLRDLAQIELSQDILDHGIVTSRAPDVTIFDSYNDFQRGPGDYDIAVSCPHILWDVKDTDKPSGRRRSNDEIYEALKWFDVVIFDEGDWASEKVRGIATLASHALKFALTASPPDLSLLEKNERDKLLSTFALISTEAIADYVSAHDLDGCVKHIDQNSIVIGAEHDQFEGFLAGQRTEFDGPTSPDHPAFLAIISQAIHDADQFETQMRRKSPDNYYSPHVIVRFDRIEDVIAAHYVLNKVLPGLPLENEGWLTTPIFMGHMKSRRLRLSPDEAELSAQNRDGSWRHPFFRAKNTKGIADKNCRRVLLMCNIGVRGINNWPIMFAVDCCESTSYTESIQFDWGRPIRLPNQFASWLSNDNLRQFVTIRIYLPKVYGWEGKDRMFKTTRDFILDMKNKIIGYNFPTWEALARNGNLQNMPLPDQDPTAPPFGIVDRLTLQNGMGIAIAAGADLTNEQEIERVIDRLVPSATGTRRDHARKYVKDLRSNPLFRDNEILATNIQREAQINPEVVVTRLKPQETYSDEVLEQFVTLDSRYAHMRQEYIDGLKTRIGRDTAARELHAVQIINYREPPRLWKLQGPHNPPEQRGALKIVAYEMNEQLLKSGALNPADRGRAIATMNAVATEFFGVASAEDNGPMDHHAYHVAILGRCRRKLQALARAKLTRNGTLANIARLAEMP
jgi:hypothetical protein